MSGYHIIISSSNSISHPVVHIQYVKNTVKASRRLFKKSHSKSSAVTAEHSDGKLFHQVFMLTDPVYLLCDTYNQEFIINI